MLTLADIIGGTRGRALEAGELPAARTVRIERVVVDSRRVVPGSVFVALSGPRYDGHDFVQQAVESGAVAIIAERPAVEGLCTTIEIDRPIGSEVSLPVCLVVRNSLRALQDAAAYWRQQHPVRCTGITGSVGKTTTKELVASVLGKRYCTLRSEGNYNNEIGLPLTLFGLEAAHERLVLEMGMYDVGEIARLAEIAQPEVGVVTNVGPSHLERLGSLERIALAKAELPQALPPAGEGGVAILNADDPYVRAMAGLTRARVLTYGLGRDADVWADGIVSEGLEGTRFRLHHADQTVYVRLPMLGRHSVHTALSAAAAGLVEGLSWDEIAAGLADQATQLRLVAVAGLRGATILDDSYNSSPASAVAALNLLAELGGRRVAVLGDMLELGSFEKEGHELVGRRAREVADILVTVGRLGRVLAEEARAAGMPAGTVHMTEDGAEAVGLLRELIRPDDVVLVKGSRGLSMEEIVSGLAADAAPVRAGAKAR